MQSLWHEIYHFMQLPLWLDKDSLISLMLSFVANLELQDTCHIQMADSDHNMYLNDWQTLETNIGELVQYKNV
jgi:hypothetical protein